MAYNVAGRFQPPPKYYTLLDPGAYQYEDTSIKKPNKVPFLSNTPRNTQPCGKIWTHTIYNASSPLKIKNCTALMSKIPRFPYEAFSAEDLEDMLCKCGIQNTCECPTEENAKEKIVYCQAKVRRTLFIGPTPKVAGSEGLSEKRLRYKDNEPPFYNARINESTAFYQGCKWSQWTSKRTIKSTEIRPGPADYTLQREPNTETICAEKVRFNKRKASKQLRYIELIQQRNILEGHPGPANYSLTLPKGTNLQYLGPKAERFPSENKVHPGPADHWVRRAFDPPEHLINYCHAKLPEQACFGVKAQRFKPRFEEGPSAASYSPNYDKPCKILRCSKVPFGCSSQRFKEIPLVEFDGEEITTKENTEDYVKSECPTPSWEFKSKTIRMKPLKKLYNEPSPADMPQTIDKITRPRQMQFLAPFFSSEGRFQSWNDWMPIHGKLKTPGSGYYDLEKPKCLSAVHHGPLYRAPRFPTENFHTPAPNEYKVGNRIETILETYNQKLKHNLEHQHKFYWEPPKTPKILSFEEKETQILNKSIKLLEYGYGEQPCKPLEKTKTEDSIKPKLLRCFLYTKQMRI